MRLPLVPVLIVLAVGLNLCAYIFWFGRRRGWFRSILSSMALWTVPSAVTVMMLIVAFSSKTSASDTALVVFMWLIFAYFSVFVPLLLFALSCLLRQLFKARAITVCGAALAALIFIAMWWGALFTRFRLDVREVDVPVRDLPEAFDGYRIVQLSDIHTGTYGDNPRFLARMVEKVSSLHPDIILFTGDIVNRHSYELEPFMNVLSGLSAPDGVWAVMGNHDYGEYRTWPSEAFRLADVENLKRMEGAMGWKMLNNSHEVIRRGNDSIVLIGVENIGDPPFTTYGNLTKAYPDISDSAVKVLMSHNPAHWVDSVAGNPGANIALTLSGHTHAMQIRLLGWSPAAFRYATWGGLYPDSLGRHLYVNIGIGEVGFPSRIGATPEITVLTLKPAE